MPDGIVGAGSQGLQPAKPVTTGPAAVLPCGALCGGARCPESSPALCGLRDLRDVLIFGAASELGLAARKRLGDAVEPRLLRADARITNQRDNIGPLPSTAFPFAYFGRRERTSIKRIEAVLAGAVSSADMRALREAAETLSYSCVDMASMGQRLWALVATASMN